MLHFFILVSIILCAYLVYITIIRLCKEIECFSLNIGDRKILTDMFIAKTGGVVCDGPFKGMHISQNSIWGDDDIGSKLIGTYEMVLHETIKDITQLYKHHPSCTVINIGCADGFYTLGMLKLLPSANVLAYDILENAGTAIMSGAEHNGISESRIKFINKEATALDIEIELQNIRCMPLLIIDCEGCEVYILDPSLCPSLQNAVILVECHDFQDRNLTPTLLLRFSETHFITNISERGFVKNSNCTHLSDFSTYDIEVIMNENRPEPMHWLYMVPKHFMINMPLTISVTSSRNYSEVYTNGFERTLRPWKAFFDIQKHEINLDRFIPTFGFQTDAWYFACARKIHNLINILKTKETNSYVIFSDADIQYFNPMLMFRLVYEAHALDLDFYGMEEISGNIYNTGFFIVRYTLHTLNMFNEVVARLDNGERPYLADQSIINEILNHNTYSINHSFIPKKYYIQGTQPDIPPSVPIFHHATGSHTTDEKVEQITAVYDMVHGQYKTLDI